MSKVAPQLEDIFVFTFKDKLPRLPRKRPDWCQIVISKKMSNTDKFRLYRWIEKVQMRGTEIEILIKPNDLMVSLAYELGADRIVFRKKAFIKLSIQKKKYLLLLADSFYLPVILRG